jgi:hypothetical protein
MMENISYTERHEHPMLDTSNVGRNALAVMADADALFEVRYPPATWGADNDHHPMVESGVNEGLPLYKWVVRSDTNEPLGLHSGTFAESGSYRYVGEMAEKMFPNSTLSCTLFGKGERMALTQNIGDVIDLGGGDQIQPSLMWISSFNGQWSTSVYDLIGRLFCANQLIGQVPLLSVKHTKHHDITFAQRTDVLSQAIEHAETIGRMAKMLKSQLFVDDQFTRLIRTIVPQPKYLKDADGNLTDRTHATAEKRMIASRDAMRMAWYRECTEFGKVTAIETVDAERVETFDGNKWLAYNAVQGAEQHRINSQFMTTAKAREKSLVRAVDGRTPYAQRALNVLTGQ